jgi:predicted SAM-dependent methyltransferase
MMLSCPCQAKAFKKFQDGPYLNIGCGLRFHERWVNVDLHPQHPQVMGCDVLAGALPFEEEVFAGVYHSHLLEHLPRHRAGGFLRECWRILRPGGVLRVVVPDLEGICRLYLTALEQSLAGDATLQERYDWVLLEMYDQVQRERSGGAMVDYLRERLDDAFAWDRLGADGTLLRACLAASSPPQVNLLQRWKQRLRKLISKSYWRERLLAWLLGHEVHELAVARFRRQGEVHRWMYDRYSLGRLLEDCGFGHIQQVEAGESRIPGWQGYFLDTQADGRPAKPDSLYMEAVKL